jgi:hypothetical protein
VADIWVPLSWATPATVGSRSSRAIAFFSSAAIAERDEHGAAWGIWADWAWTQDVPALPAASEHLNRWLAEADIPEATVNEVLTAIDDVHYSAGYGPGWTGRL